MNNGIMKLIRELADEHGCDRRILYDLYEDVSVMYPNISYRDYKNCVRKVCSTPIAKTSPSYEKHKKNVNPNIGVNDKIKLLAEKNGYNRKKTYEEYDKFVKNYPHLSRESFNAMVRGFCIEPLTYAHPKLGEWRRKLNTISNILNFDIDYIKQTFDIFKKEYPDLQIERFRDMMNIACREKAEQDKSVYISDDMINIVNNLYLLQKKQNELIKNELNNKSISMPDYGNESFKRMVVLSDLHCGHELGLTPPSWWYNMDNVEKGHIAKIQRDAWAYYETVVKRIVGIEIDMLVINGDLIDGKAVKNEAVELITSDRVLQTKIGIECVEIWNPKTILMTRGTAYHVGKGEQYEDIAAELLGAKISDTLEFKFNGKVFNFRHKVNSSTVPYGKSTPLVKEAVWNTLASEYKDTPKADILVRSHIHNYIEYRDSNRIAIITPALQVNSRYGLQQCTGYTDFGFIVIDVYDNGKVIVHTYISNLKDSRDNTIDEY